MMRALFYGLTVLHLGPGIAFGLLAFGCERPAPLLGAVCNMGALASFVLLTFGSWLILSAGLASIQLVRLAGPPGPARTRWRVGALLAVLPTGALLGGAGTWLTGSPAWWLAVPATLATAWLFLSNPLECQPRR